VGGVGLTGVCVIVGWDVFMPLVWVTVVCASLCAAAFNEGRLGGRCGACACGVADVVRGVLVGGTAGVYGGE